jgi:subtilisin family serine protease
MSVPANDPYYVGFGAAAPYFETATLPGQWDMHVMNVSGAWDVVGASPKGAAIAIVDTGADITHPELTGGKVTRTQCYVTFPSDSKQSSGKYVTDTDGHGTNVAGIADANANNGLGFVGAVYSAPLMIYRIFPTTPDGGCQNSTDPQCTTSTLDEASAINDAVSHGAKVINLSLGGQCSGNDVEYQAVENAIAHGVVVVAAAGNDGQGQLDCPAADPGVIAVGASALDDSGSVKEVVASYSNYLMTNGSGHFLVAPGGDPSGNDDSDDLHWIENIYSSTAQEPGTCTPDFQSPAGVKDCRLEIAGTSQATPHVAAVASLILAVRPSYTPAQVAAALCNSAANINDAKQGCGRVDAAAAVAYAKSH